MSSPLTLMPPGLPVAQVQTAEQMRREAWLKERRTMITGTDAAQILGLSKWGGPFDVWMAKTGKDAPEVSSEVQSWRTAGHRMERTILQWYADVLGESIQFADSFTLLRSAKYPRIGATLDARRISDGRPVDAKNIRYKDETWGDEGTDQFPLYYGAQGIFQMHVTDNGNFDLPVLFTGQDFCPYTMARNVELEEDIIGECMAWWDKHITTDTPPQIDGSKSAAEFLKRTLKQVNELTVVATPEQSADADALAALKVQLDALQVEHDAIENRFKLAIGEAKSISGVAPSGVSWYANYSQTKDSMGTDWEALAKVGPDWEALVRHYLPAVTDDMLEPFATKVIAPSMLKRFEKVTKRGSRRFTFNYKGTK